LHTTILDHLFLNWLHPLECGYQPSPYTTYCFSYSYVRSIGQTTDWFNDSLTEINSI